MSSFDRFKSRKTRVAYHKKQKSLRSKLFIPEENVLNNMLESTRSGTRVSTKRGRRPRTKGNSKLPMKDNSVLNKNSIRHCLNSPVNPQILDREMYIGSDNQIYNVGDTVYVQSDTISTPYFIGQILDFKSSRKDEKLAEIQWFYRPSEVPASVLDSLMQDRLLQADNHEENISHFLIENQIRSRELFRSGITNSAECSNLTSASLFQGICTVLALSEITDLKDFSRNDDNFFCILGFDPITRRLSDFKGEIRIGASHQATLPSVSGTSDLSNLIIEDQLWNPNIIEDSELQMYLKASRSIIMHSGWCLRGRIDDGLMAMQSDSLTQKSFDILNRNQYCTRTSLKQLLVNPNTYEILYEKIWAQEETKNFYKGIRKFGKHFNRIRDEFLPDKTIDELVFYYYHWKRSSVGLASRSQRKTRKSLHLKKNRIECHNSLISLHDLFIEIYSADEFEQDDNIVKTDKGDLNTLVFSKDPKYRICQHCYSSNSNSWHHGGIDNLLLCDNCRVFYCKYAQMPNIPNFPDPPPHILRDVSKKDLIYKINEERFLMENSNSKSNRELSDMTDSSDSDSFNSDIDRIDPNFKMLKPLSKESINCKNDSNSESRYVFSHLSNSDVSCMKCIQNQMKNTPKTATNLIHTSGLKSKRQIPVNSGQNPSLFSLANLPDDHASHCVRANISEPHDTILKTLLESTLEKSSLNRPEIKVISYDRNGDIISTDSYEDKFIDESMFDSDAVLKSPTMKKDFLLFLSEPRQGAARFDFHPRSNILDVINRRKNKHGYLSALPHGESIGLLSTEVSHSNEVTDTNSFASSQYSPKQLPDISILSDASLMQNLPNNSFNHSMSSVLQNSLGSSGTSSNIENTGTISERNNLIGGNSIVNPDQLDQVRSKLLILDQNTFGQLGCAISNSSQNISKLPIQISATGSLSISPRFSQLVGEKYSANTSHSFEPLSSRSAELIPTLSYSNSIPQNLTLLSSSSSGLFTSNMASIPSSETVVKDIPKISSTNLNWSNTLQPQIPGSNHLIDSSTSSQSLSTCNMITSKSNHSLQNFQISSQSNATPGIQLPNLNAVHSLMPNNVIVGSVPDSNGSQYLNFASQNDKIGVDLTNIDKNAYQNYLNILQNQMYSNQMNAFILSHLQNASHSNSQLQVPFQSQMLPPQLNTQMPHIAHIPTNYISTTSQSQAISMSGFYPYSNDMISQLSTLPFRLNSDQSSSSDKIEKK